MGYIYDLPSMTHLKIENSEISDYLEIWIEGLSYELTKEWIGLFGSAENGNKG